jgi:hypothetical protein
MDDLVEFLRDRLDEDEAAAKAADGDEIEATPSLWGTKYLTLRGDHDDRHTTELPAELSDHIARHDPARILAEVAAKRQLLEKYAEVADNDINEMEYAHGYANAFGEAVRLLALPYAYHLDYDEAWRP